MTLTTIRYQNGKSCHCSGACKRNGVCPTLGLLDMWAVRDAGAVDTDILEGKAFLNSEDITKGVINALTKK